MLSWQNGNFIITGIEAHSSLEGKTPNEKFSELIDFTPIHAEVGENYHPEKEHIILQNYGYAKAVKLLKQPL